MAAALSRPASNATPHRNRAAPRGTSGPLQQWSVGLGPDAAVLQLEPPLKPIASRNRANSFSRESGSPDQPSRTAMTPRKKKRTGGVNEFWRTGWCPSMNPLRSGDSGRSGRSLELFELHTSGHAPLAAGDPPYGLVGQEPLDFSGVECSTQPASPFRRHNGGPGVIGCDLARPSRFW